MVNKPAEGNGFLFSVLVNTSTLSLYVPQAGPPGPARQQQEEAVQAIRVAKA